MSDNPYQSPTPTPTTIAARRPSVISLRRALTMIAASTLIFSVIGGFLGYALGQFAPDYYRTVFARTDGNFNSVQVGIGLGMTQGAAAGAFIGFGLVALAAWFDSRRVDRGPAPDSPR